jgi:cell division protein FtsQ
MSRAVSARRGLPPSADVSAQADKRFRRSETRPDRRKWSRFASRAGGLAALAVVAVGLLAAGVTVALRASVLTVSQIVVRGNARLSPAEVEALLDGMRGENVLRVDFEEYRKRLVDTPWVADVVFARVLPATVVVRIDERVPMAIARMGQQLYLVDDEGVIIDHFGPQYRDVDLPIVDGLVRSPRSGGVVVDPAAVRVTGRFLDAVEARPELRQRVSQIDVTDPHDLVVLLDDDPVQVHVGEARFVERLTLYLQAAPRLREESPGIDSADLRLDDIDRMYVRTKPAPADDVGPRKVR